MHLEGVLIQDRMGDTLMFAGDVKVRITDWFFFKKEAELKYIGLENAIIKFQRSDSVWRQQFIFDYFASPKTGTRKKKAGIKFDLKDVEFKNVTFVQKDAWLGQDLSMYVGQMKMLADTLSLSSKEYEINSLLLVDPVVKIHNYARLKPAVVALEPATEVVQAVSWNSGQTGFKIGNVKIVNGTFQSDRQLSRPVYSHFDGQYVLFNEINGELSNATFRGDTVYSKLQLKAKERSGLELKNLTADMKITPQSMVFSNMKLQTNRSTIGNFFSMNYNDISDMADFVHKVKMAGYFEDSYVDSDDIAFFAPAMKTWNKNISIEGKVRGSVDELVGRDMVVQAGNSTILNGDINLTGLPDINQTFIDFKANDFRTTYNDAATMVPALRKVTVPNLRKLQYISFRGSFTGFVRDFVTYGTIQTNLGTVKTDLNMKLPYGKDPVYSGKIETDHFRLGEFIDNKDIGAVAMTGTIKGSGFTQNRINSVIDGTVRFAEYKNYRYENIIVKGHLNKKRFEGVASIRDKNADLDLNGIIDFNLTTPKFDLVADVNNINFKNLNLTKSDIGFRGNLNFNFTSRTIDDFLGNARITNAVVTKDGKRLPFDSLIVSSQYINGVKTFTAVSNEAEATIRGDFYIAGIPDAFRYLLNKYYPAYISKPTRFPGNQNIEFNVTTYNVDEYLQLMDSTLSGFNNSHIEGNMNLAKSELNLTAQIPQIKLAGYNFDDINIKATGTPDSLVINGITKNIRINDSLNIPEAVFHINAHNDQSRVSIVTGANQTLEKANLNALVSTYSDGVEIDFDPSSFILNGKTWTIDETGKLSFRRNTPISGQLVLAESDQRITLRTIPSTKGRWNDIRVDLVKLNLGDFAPFFMPGNRIEGLVSGNVLVEDPTNNLKITSDNIQTQSLRFDNDSLGELRTSLSYEKSTNELIIKGNTLNQENYLGFDAKISLGNAASQKNNLIALKARNFQIKILERFLGALFSDMQGYLTGDIFITGAFNNLSVAGKGHLKDAGLKINFTQVFYKIQDTDIEMKTTEINLDGLVLIDTATGNPLYVTGGIEHQSFKNMFYNLNVSTRKPNTTSDANNKPVLLLNTQYKDNKQFYGHVYGTGSLTLAGPQSDMFMTINAIASETDSSEMNLPIASTRETGLASFLVERKFGQEMEATVSPSAVNIIYDVEVTATPAVTVRVVLDELTGDEIKGRGAGTLHIRSGTAEPLTLRGRFDITQGEYLFTFQSFFKKPFVLREGEDNYIEWYGDPNEAIINLTAVYTATNVSFAPLASSLINIDQGLSRARGDVYVVAKLTERLMHPKFDFSLEFPPSSVVNSDPALAFSLQQLQKNENEINKQATYLVVLGVFAPVEGSSNGFNLGEVATNSLSGIFFNVINEQIRKIFSGIFKSDKLNFNFNTTLYNRNVIGNSSAFNLGSNVNASIGSSLFKGRVTISVGGSVEGLLQTGSTQQQVGFLKDFTIEIMINPSGSFRATIFSRDNVDYLTSNVSGSGRQNRTGVGVSFHRDFNHIGDIFRRKKKQVPPPPPVEPAAVETGTEEVPKN